MLRRWQSASVLGFGTKRPPVQIRPPRPAQKACDSHRTGSPPVVSNYPGGIAAQVMRRRPAAVDTCRASWHCVAMALPVRLVAALFAVFALVALFGIIDLAVVLSPSDEFRPIVMLEAGWGLLFTVLVAAAFAAVAVWPRRCTPPLVQIGVVIVTLAVAAALGGGALWLVAVGLSAALIVLVAMLPKDREPLWPQPGSVSWPLAALTVAGVVLWLWYGTRMFMLAQQPSATTDDTLGVNHYQVQGALAVALVGLTGLTVKWPRFRSWVGISAGTTAAALGASNLAWSHSAGAFPVGWAVCAVIWGVLLAGASWVSRDHRKPEQY